MRLWSAINHHCSNFFCQTKQNYTNLNSTDLGPSLSHLVNLILTYSNAYNFDCRCCKLLLSRATQTPNSITQEIHLDSRKKSWSRIQFTTSFKQMSSTVSEEKASRVLGVVFCTFVICWAPFFIMNFVVGLCGQACAPPGLIGEMALWFGYASSTINPLIYTVFNIKFRRSFGKLLLCRARSLSNGHVQSSL